MDQETSETYLASFRRIFFVKELGYKKKLCQNNEIVDCVCISYRHCKKFLKKGICEIYVSDIQWLIHLYLRVHRIRILFCFILVGHSCSSLVMVVGLCTSPSYSFVWCPTIGMDSTRDCGGRNNYGLEECCSNHLHWNTTVSKDVKKDAKIK